MYRSHLSLTAFLLVAMLAAAVPAFPQTDIHLSTEKAGGGAIPIVVREFRAESEVAGKTAEYISSVLVNDLSYTSIFEPLRFEAGADTLAGGKTASAIVEGTVIPEIGGEGFILEARLLDYSSREVIFSKRYGFQRRVRRSIAHHLCDEILYFLAGERGVATTRLLFTRKDGDLKSLFLIDYDGYDERKLTDGELIVSPVWLDSDRFCFTSYKRDNPDCYLVQLAEGTRRNISHRKGINIAGGYYAGRDEIVMTLSVRGNSEIYITDSAGKIMERLTKNRAIDCSPSWAPNGVEIAFVSDRSRSPQVFVMDSHGGNVRRLTRSGSYNTSPAWSPRGDLIAYVSRDGWLYRLKLISPDGLWEETVFEDYLSYEDPCWAPDGRHMAATVRFGGEPWIVIIDIESGHKRRLTRGESASWSPLAEE